MPPEVTYFKLKEFACKCGCGLQIMDLELIAMLDIIREVLAKPLVIRSGCRCKDRNVLEGGAENSDHLKGRGVDVKVIDSHTRFVIINHAIALGISRIGVSRQFIHLGRNPENPQEVFWLH